MVWFPSSKEEADAISELASMSDRAAAIVAASILEQRIEASLKSIFLDGNRPKSKGGTIAEQLFQFSGPFGAFSTKIDMLFMVGALTKEAYRDLFYIKEIRNCFAHSIGANSFNSAPAKDLARELRFFEKHIGEQFIASEDDPPPAISPMIYVKDRDAELQNPRQRYLICVALFTSTLFTYHRSLPRPPLCKTLL